MDRADKFINNSAPRRILLIFLAAAAFFAGLDFVFAGKIADQVSRRKLEAYLSGAGGGSITREAEESAVAAGEEGRRNFGVDRNMPLRLVSGWFECRNGVFWLFFAVTTSLSAAWAALAIHCLFREYDGMEKLGAECRKSAESSGYSVTLQGGSSDCLRRLSENADLLARRMNALDSELNAERRYLRGFLGDFSHQIKTSLAAVRLNFDMLAENEDLSPERREVLSDEIQMNLDAMEELVVQAIKTARMETSSIDYNMVSGDLSVTCRKALKRIEPLLRSRNIAVNADLPEGVLLPHDKGWLCEAIENIIKNSADHSGCTEVFAAVEEDPVMVKLILSDNGCGIPQEDIPRLFERFSHSSGDRSMRSAGMGMSIAKKIVNSHGGEIYVYSGVGTGSRFELVFLKEV